MIPAMNRRHAWLVPSHPLFGLVVFSVCRPRSPGGLPISALVRRVRLVAGRTFERRLAGRVGVRVRVRRAAVRARRRVRVGRRVRASATATDSPPGTSSIATSTKRSAVPVATPLGQRARDVAQEQRHVVARRLRRGQERQRRAQAVGRQRQPIEPLLDRAGSGRSARASWTGSAGAGRASSLGRQVARPLGECVGQHRGALRKRGERPAQVLEQLPPCRSGTTAIGRTVGDHGLECRRRLRDPVLEVRIRDAGQRREGRVQVRVQVGLRAGPPARARSRSSRARGRTRRGRCWRDARLRATGPRSVTSGTNAPIALLMSSPRPASASLKPIVASETPVRVARGEHPEAPGRGRRRRRL